MNDLKDSEKDEMQELLEMCESQANEIDSLRSEKEQLRQENEQLKRQNGQDSEAQKKISSLSSQVSMLKSKVQEQAQEIVDLNEQIETLNNSDLQLKEAQEKERNAKRLNEQWQKDKQDTLTEASAAKAEADKQVRDMKSALASREKAVDAKEKRLNDIESDVEGEVGKRVLELGTKKLNKLEKDYKAKNKELDDKYYMMTAGYKMRYYMSLYYGIVITVLTAAFSEVFRKEFITFFSKFFEGFAELVMGVWNIGGFVAKLGDMIPQETVAFIVHWLLQLVISLGGGFVLVILAINGFVKFKDMFKEHFADEITVAVMLLILAIIVFGAEYIALLPVNLLLLYILSFVGYMLVRAFLAWDDAEAKKNFLVYTGLTIFIIVAVWFGLRSLARDLAELTK